MKKKLLIITADMKPNIGGVAELVVTYACALTKRYRISILTNVPGNRPEDAALPYHVTRIPMGGRVYTTIDRYSILRRIRGMGYRFFMKWNAWRSFRVAVVCNPDVVLFGCLTQYEVQIGSGLLRKGIPYAVFIHGRDFGMNGRRGRRVLEHANLVFVNSHFTAEMLRKEGVTPQKVEIAYPPILPKEWDEARENKTILQELGLENKEYILSLGRIVARKGFDQVIDVWPDVLRDHPELLYVICGKEMDYASQLRDRVLKLGIEGQVVFYEAPAGDFSCRKALLKNCLFHVMPAREEPGGDVEGFGISYMEAALFGKPSIAGRDGGCAEAVLHNETGTVVDGRDREALLNAMLEWIDSPEKVKKLGRHAQERARHDFSVEALVVKLSNAIEQSVGAG